MTKDDLVNGLLVLYKQHMVKTNKNGESVLNTKDFDLSEIEAVRLSLEIIKEIPEKYLEKYITRVDRESIEESMKFIRERQNSLVLKDGLISNPEEYWELNHIYDYLKTMRGI